MIQAKCIQKFRDNNNKIYGYRLIDINGQTQDVKSDNLKKAIANKSIHVVNLTLTSDNRLVDTTEKQLQSKELGEKPVKRFTKKQETLMKIAKIIAKNFTYHIDESSIEDDRIQLHRKYMFKTYITLTTAIKREAVQINDISDVFGYKAKETEIPNTYVIYVGSDEIPFETDEIQFVADKDGISKMLNNLEKIIHLFTRVSGCNDLLKLAFFIAYNNESDLPEANLNYSLLEKIANTYNIDINSVMNLIQERIDLILKYKSYIQELREKIIEESKHHNSSKLIDTEEEDKEYIDKLVNAAVCYVAITSQKEEAYVSAYYFHDKSDLDCRFEYKSASDNNTDETSKMEEFMLQVARTIFKSLGVNKEAKELAVLDNSYDDMIDKRYDIAGQYMYFDDEKSMLAITYYGKDYEGVDKPEFWLAIEIEGEDEASSSHEMRAESTSKDDIKNTVAKFIKEVKPHISFS